MEQGIPNITALVSRILAFVCGSGQELKIGEVERRLLPMVMAVGRAVLEEFVAAKNTGYAGKEIVEPQGHRLPYERYRGCAYRSIFGRILIRRAYYHAAGSPGIFPLDREFNLSERGYSYLVQEFSSRLAVTMNYEDAGKILSSFFLVRIPIRSLESIVGDLCDDVNRYYEGKPEADLSPDAAVTVATVDKKGVVIRKSHGERSGSEAPPADPDKPGKKKMATVISTYVTPRHIRTTEEIIREVSDQDGFDSKPKPQHKITWGSLTDGPENTVARLKMAVDQRLPEGNELVCILDGERSLWALVFAYFPTAFFVLDIFHVLEHLGKAALCFYDEGSPHVREFVTERLIPVRDSVWNMI